MSRQGESLNAAPSRRPGAARRRAFRAWGPRPHLAGGTSSPPGSAVAPVPSGRLRAAALAALLIAVLAAVLHTRPFLLSRLDITGLRQVTRSEVVADLALPAGTYTWQVRPWVLRRRLTADPMIAHARIGVHLPDRLSVALVERVPVALLLEGRTAWEIDHAGRLLRAVPATGGHVSLAGLPPDLPEVVGARLPAPQAGRLVRTVPVLRALRVAESLGGAAGAEIAAVTVAADGTVGVRTAGGVPVDYGSGRAAVRQTEELLGILTCAGGLGVRLASVDLAAPATPAVRVRPGSPAWTQCPSAAG